MRRNKLRPVPTPGMQQFTPALTERQAYRYAERLKALADPTRLLLLNLLAHNKGQVEEGEITVGRLVEAFELEQPTISHHLRILKTAGFIEFWKNGLYVHYYINEDVLPDLFNVLEEVFERNKVSDADVDDVGNA